MPQVVEIKDLLGIPYKQHGRDRQGFDCYGLVIFLYKRIGIEIPDFWYKTVGNNAFDEVGDDVQSFIKGYWQEVNKPEYSNVILFFDSCGRTVHIAFYLGRDMFIHCDIRGVEVKRLKGFRYAARRFYKWLPQK